MTTSSAGTAATPPATPHRGRTRSLRAGLILAALLGVGDVVTGVQAVTGEFFAPPEVGIGMIVLGVITVALVPVAWTGRRWAAWVAVAARVLSAMTALPAFFVPDVPAAGVIAASAGLLLTATVAVLVAFGLTGPAGRR